MSALPQSQNLYRVLRRVGEPEAIRLIGRLALSASDAATGLESLAGVALRLDAVHGVEVTPAPQLSETGLFEWHTTKSPAPCGSAMAAIVAGSIDWGRLRLLFKPRIRSVECPLKFARFLGQQMAIMLNRLDLLLKKETLESQVTRLQERLETRKLVHRSAGILAASRAISHSEAIRYLARYAHQSRRTLLQLAQAIILGGETASLRPPVLRRLHQHESTGPRQPVPAAQFLERFSV